MKKNLIIGFVLATSLVSVTAFAFSFLPTAAETQIGAHERDSKAFEKTKIAYQEQKGVEWQSFCLMIDLMRAERIEVDSAQSKRYDKEKCADIYGKYDMLKLPEQSNSKGEAHPDQYFGEGDSEKEKTRSYVERNCSPEIFEVFDETYDYAKEAGINPSIPFAVIFADSTCGKNLTTPNNPGNVNNNDRGNRVGFFSMEDGINAVTDTLNNKYIGGIKVLGHLSQGGRNEIGSKYQCADAPAPYKCYASGGENWNNNTQRALRAMGNEDVDGNFLIRN